MGGVAKVCSLSCNFLKLDTEDSDCNLAFDVKLLGEYERPKELWLLDEVKLDLKELVSPVPESNEVFKDLMVTNSTVTFQPSINAPVAQDLVLFLK